MKTYTTTVELAKSHFEGDRRWKGDDGDEGKEKKKKEGKTQSPNFAVDEIILCESDGVSVPEEHLIGSRGPTSKNLRIAQDGRQLTAKPASPPFPPNSCR